MKSIAAVCFAPNEPFEILEIDVALPKETEVLVEYKIASICQTDLHTWKGIDPEGVFPVILGHEGSGVVKAVGSKVRDFVPGDEVMPLYIPECGVCKFCKSKKTNLCQAIRATQGKGVMPDGTSRFSYQGRPIYHFMGSSTFSQYSVLPEISLVKKPKSIGHKYASLFACGVTTGLGAAYTQAELNPESKICVFGLGTVGLSVIQGAKSRGVKDIYAVDIDENRAELAIKCGASQFINPTSIKGKISDHLVAISEGGFDYTFECVGDVKVMREALESCHKGWGQSIIIGVAPAGHKIETLPFQLVTGRVWKGCAFGGVKGKSQLNQYFKMLEDQVIDLDIMLDQQFSLNQINQAINFIYSGGAKKVLIDFENC